MTIFYETKGLIISDTGVVLEGRKILLTKIDSWRLYMYKDMESMMTPLGDVGIVLKTIFPRWFYNPTEIILLTDKYVAFDDFNEALRINTLLRNRWKESGEGEGPSELDPARFEARVNEYKLITRALDMMMASKQA